MNSEVESTINVLNKGGVCVIPTDTLYGIVSRALDMDAVAKVYNLKNRSDGKPFIVLISSLEDLDKVSIDISEKTRNFLLSVWPGPVSVVLSCRDENLEYLHDGMDLAVRWPDNTVLNDIIKQTGPLVAPSANPEGLKTATTIDEARKYFGSSVDFYLDGGLLEGEPSALISLRDGEVKILRQGRGKI